MVHPRARRVKVDIDDVVEIFDGGLPQEMGAYLDLDTGDVVTVSDDIQSALSSMREELDDLPAEDDAAYDTVFAARLEQSDLPPWMREAVLEADAVERGYGTRFISVPRTETHEAYEDMQDFIESVRDERLQERLDDAIRGRGAFGRFRAVLSGAPSERERWFAFRHERARERALDWLADEGIEVAPRE